MKTPVTAYQRDKHHWIKSIHSFKCDKWIIQGHFLNLMKVCWRKEKNHQVVFDGGIQKIFNLLSNCYIYIRHTRSSRPEREKKKAYRQGKKKKWKYHGPQILRLQYVESKIIQLLKYKSLDYWVPGWATKASVVFYTLDVSKWTWFIVISTRDWPKVSCVLDKSPSPELYPRPLLPFRFQTRLSLSCPDWPSNLYNQKGHKVAILLFQSPK